ncbi:ankyrin repeat domain-containing protein [Cupriavidus gilardii]|uniref:ankyrin repeat domain-containing protein n=1 Tax=Cupriavidus gilardii TaxID=82541 RepID=UPI001ABED7BC|nr:ankyrin repeat domain-containing protein [Cupriavidus gilardii]MBO4123107.1 ankyrin repeat domain-containing protein [Cupriavidus gilardii]
MVELKALCQLLEHHKDDQALAQLAQRPVLATASLPDGRTILHQEVCRHQCSADVIDALLRAGADVNAANDRGVTVLMLAASKHNVRESDLKIFTRLLLAGAKHDSVDGAGKTALMNASEHHNSHAIKELLRAGADANARDLLGNTPLMYVAGGSGPGPIGSKREDPIRLLLQAGADPHVANRQGKTALMMAAEKGNSTELRMLLEAGANPKVVDKYGWSALMHAAEHKHSEAVEDLLTYYAVHGLELNDEERRDVIAKGLRLLSVAQAQARHRLQCALQGDGGQSPTAKDVEAFHRYLEERNETGLSELLSRSPTLARKPVDTFFWRTPLHVAIGKKCGGPVLEALLKAGANIDERAKSKNTPLMEAISTFNDDALNTLLLAGADTETRDSMGKTPLLKAASRFGNPANAIDALLRAGADIEAVDTYGKTALMHAASAKSPPAIEALLNAGAKPDAKDGMGTTALMWAARDRNSSGTADRCRDAIHSLLRGRANLRATDNEGNTALMWAAKSANRDAAEALQLAYAVRRLPISEAEQRALRENKVPLLTPDQLQARIAAYQDWLHRQPNQSSPEASKPSARVQPLAAQPPQGGDTRARAGSAPDRLGLLEAENSQLRMTVEKLRADHQTVERQLDAMRAELAQQQAHAAEREAVWQAESARWHAQTAALTQRMEQAQDRLARQQQQTAEAKASLQGVHDKVAGVVPDLMRAIQSLSHV